MRSQTLSKQPIIVRGDPDLASLIPDFLNNRRKDVCVMQEATSIGDYERVRMLGHSIKGSGGGYGFDAITEFGMSLESAALSGDRIKIKRALELLDDYLQRVEVVYD